MELFSEWLQSQLDAKGMTKAQLARASGIREGTIGNILRSDRNPGTDVCNGLAKGLKLPPELVFRKAGLLPTDKKDKVNDLAYELADLVSALDDSAKDEVLNFVKFKLYMQSSKEKYQIK